MAVTDDLDVLLQSLPNYSLLTPGMKEAALNGAWVPDSSGLWPGNDGYEPTYDVYFAALTLLGYLQAQPMVTNANSEGTGVTVTKPDWTSLIAYYRSMSSIVMANGNSVLQKVIIPDGPHVVRTDMSGKGSNYYGDVDTDLS